MTVIWIGHQRSIWEFDCNWIWYINIKFQRIKLNTLTFHGEIKSISSAKWEWALWSTILRIIDYDFESTFLSSHIPRSMHNLKWLKKRGTFSVFTLPSFLARQKTNRRQPRHNMISNALHILRRGGAGLESREHMWIWFFPFLVRLFSFVDLCVLFDALQIKATRALSKNALAFRRLGATIIATNQSAQRRAKSGKSYVVGRLGKRCASCESVFAHVCSKALLFGAHLLFDVVAGFFL